MIQQMGVDVINAMAFFGFLVGMAVVGLTVYTLTLERAREFAVIKAIGADRRQLLRIVFEQAAFSVFLGLLAGLALSLGVRRLVEDQVTAVDNITSQASKGDVVLIMGPSGSGKTTLLSIAGALL